MTRGRIILIAAIVVVTFGAAWWLLSDGLSAEERRLVGTWHCDVRNATWPGGLTVVWDVAGNRSIRLRYLDPTTRDWHRMPDGTPNEAYGRWYVAADELLIEWGPGGLGRLRQLLPAAVPGSLPRQRPEAATIVAASADELVLRYCSGEAYRLRRPPGH